MKVWTYANGLRTCVCVQKYNYVGCVEIMLSYNFDAINV